MSAAPEARAVWRPDWPVETLALIADRIRKCKDEIVSVCMHEIERSASSPIEFFGRAYQRRRDGDFLALVDLCLELDPEVLEEIPDVAGRQVGEIVARAEAEVEARLDPEQRAELEQEGFRALFASVYYPGMTEFFVKMNGMPPAGRNQGNYEELFCPKPFEYAEISQRGETFVCCPLQIPTTVGDARDGTFLDVWNSEQAQSIRRSILDGSFSYCLEKTCPLLQNRALPKRDQVTDPYHRDIIDNGRTELDRGPETIFLNYDRSCNLACPTCRTELIALKGQAKGAAEQIQSWATAGHLEDVRRLHITGSGDALGGSIFHGFLRSFDSQSRPDLRISIGTNGLLFTESNWERICKDAIDIVVVSVDAATPETYRSNRGGDFGLLLENLHFIGRLRASGQLKVFGINFVVQANNYREMPAFVELGHRVRADTVNFQQLTNWGTFSLQELAERAVHEPSHPEHDRFLEVLAGPKLGLPIVDMSNLSALRAAQLARAGRAPAT